MCSHAACCVQEVCNLEMNKNCRKLNKFSERLDGNFYISEFVLFDLNRRAVNDELGREVFDIGGFRQNMEHQIVISYKNVRF